MKPRHGQKPSASKVCFNSDLSELSKTRTLQKQSMNELKNNATLTVEIVGELAKEISTIEPTWQRAFLRISKGIGIAEAKASYVGPTGIIIVNVLEHKTFFHWVVDITDRFFETLDATRPVKVALVVLNSDLSYELTYEYDDPQRWTISKLNGGTGVPAGL